MNTNKFKTMLFLCVIGVANCNKIGSPSYMDGSGDRKGDSKEKRRKIGNFYGDSKAGTSSAVSASARTLSQGARLNIQIAADSAQKAADLQEKAAEDALNFAQESQVTADKMREACNRSGTKSKNKLLEDTRISMQKAADSAQKAADLQKKAAEDAMNFAQESQVTADKMREACKYVKK